MMRKTVNIKSSARATVVAVIAALCCAIAASGGQPATLPKIVKENLIPIDLPITGFRQRIHEDNVFRFLVTGDFGCHKID